MSGDGEVEDQENDTGVGTGSVELDGGGEPSSGGSASESDSDSDRHRRDTGIEVETGFENVPPTAATSTPGPVGNVAVDADARADDDLVPFGPVPKRESLVANNLEPAPEHWEVAEYLARYIAGVHGTCDPEKLVEVSPGLATASRSLLTSLIMVGFFDRAPAACHAVALASVETWITGAESMEPWQRRLVDIFEAHDATFAHLLGTGVARDSEAAVETILKLLNGTLPRESVPLPMREPLGAAIQSAARKLEGIKEIVLIGMDDDDRGHVGPGYRGPYGAARLFAEQFGLTMPRDESGARRIRKSARQAWSNTPES